jgi:hypothetical protein
MPQRDVHMHSNGMVKKKDRLILVSNGDKIQWKPDSGNFTIRFFNPSNNPFVAPTSVDLQTNQTFLVVGAPGDYKYCVVDNVTGDIVDDPNVIIES